MEICSYYRMNKQGSIYKIMCNLSGLCYIGQAQDTKTKLGKEYAYGVTGRWNDHVSCKSKTPLSEAIQKYGAEQFKIETLESNIPEDRLDEREAYWIATLRTRIPNGYNVMRHGRCRHRNASSLSNFYAPITTGIKLRQIHKNGDPHLIYAYLTLIDSDEVRVTFGQGEKCTYFQAIQEARAFLEAFATIPIDADPRILNPTATEYDSKLSRFDNCEVQRIRIAKFNNLVAVYIDKDRICFGGKTIIYDQAVEKARTFAKLLHNKHPEATLIDNASKSATGGCSSS